jgi:hypothetical protein
VVIVLGFDQGNGQVLVIEHVIRPPGLAAGDQLAAHNDTAPGETYLPADLGGFIPASLDNSGRDALGADVGFAQIFLIHGRIIPGAAAGMPVSRNTKVLCASAYDGAWRKGRLYFLSPGVDESA